MLTRNIQGSLQLVGDVNSDVCGAATDCPGYKTFKGITALETASLGSATHFVLNQSASSSAKESQ